MSRIFGVNGDPTKCEKKCEECEWITHHWILYLFEPGDTDDPSYREDAQKWWEAHPEHSIGPICWACKHCTAWTPYDPDECCCECMGELKTDAEQEGQVCEACAKAYSELFGG